MKRRVAAGIKLTMAPLPPPTQVDSVGNNKTAALVLGVLCCAAAPAAAQGCPPDTAVADEFGHKMQV